MQLRFTVPFWLTGSNFKPSLSAVLSGTTAIGAISVAIYNSNIAWDSIGNSLKSLKDTPVVHHLLKGIEKVGNTFQNWGSAIVSSKDAFSDWFKRYFDANGLKAGVFALYEKLKVWVLIVYEWFATKFIEFLGNIPEMVKNWDKLRLSLFKWGTFLGGGGGSALWAALGSGANLSKLGELMGREDFADMMKDFDTLVQDNPKAFEDLGAEGIEKIIQEYLDNPEKAKEVAKELIKDQEKKKADAEKEQNPEKPEEEKEKLSKELTAEEISAKFDSSKTGSPPNKASVLKGMVDKGLNGLLSSYSFEPPQKIAKKAMEKYLKDLEEDVKKERAKNPKKPSSKAKFWGVIENKKDEFVEGLSKAAAEAYLKAEKPDLPALTKAFINALTEPSKDGQGNAEGLIKALQSKSD